MYTRSVQMVMLTAPVPETSGLFYAEVLACEWVERSPREVILDGHGLQIVISSGAGGGHLDPPPPDGVNLELMVPMSCIQAAWERDRRMGREAGPVLQDTGSFVYVTLDPAHNAISLMAPLPPRSELEGERTARP
ncbi:MAG: hypothetical protein OEY14_12750, partial [Myxococcales bacterium]|nr:hypothetical protein [Myxococcales bacterium]